MTADKQSKLSDLIEQWHAEPLDRQQLILLTSLLLIERKEMMQQLAAAREVIEKLPKTKDGFPVIPEQEYFAVCIDDPESGGEVVIRKVVWVGNCKPWVDFDWSTADGEYCETDSYGVRGVYSTREAAEKAKIGGSDAKRE